MFEVASDMLKHKWPKEDNDLGIFRFIFECNSFLIGFFQIGIFLYNYKLNEYNTIFVYFNNFQIESIKQKDVFQEKIGQIVSLLDNTSTKLADGSIEIVLFNVNH